MRLAVPMSNFGIHIDFKKSKGGWVYDKKTDRKYLDFLCHFSSLPFGYSPEFMASTQFEEDIIEVAHMKIAMCEYYSDQRIELARELKQHIPSEYSTFHFACTGSLAVEAAVKASFAYHDYKREKVISITNSFHGVNSYGNDLSTSSRLDGMPKNFDFQSLPIEHVLEHPIFLLNRKRIACIVIEPVQCTYGDNWLDVNRLAEIRKACDEHNIVLIYDEVQTGLSLGTTFYFEQLPDAKPDIVVFGKKFQVSGIAIKNGFEKIIEDYWRLSVTWDGDATDMVRSRYILQEIRVRDLHKNMINIGSTIVSELKKNNYLENVRGQGGILAFDLPTKKERDQLYKDCFEDGLMINPTGERTIRLRPNMCTTQEEIEFAISVINKNSKIEN